MLILKFLNSSQIYAPTSIIFTLEIPNKSLPSSTPISNNKLTDQICATTDKPLIFLLVYINGRMCMSVCMSVTVINKLGSGDGRFNSKRSLYIFNSILYLFFFSFFSPHLSFLSPPFFSSFLTFIYLFCLSFFSLFFTPILFPPSLSFFFFLISLYIYIYIYNYFFFFSPILSPLLFFLLLFFFSPIPSLFSSLISLLPLYYFFLFLSFY